MGNAFSPKGTLRQRTSTPSSWPDAPGLFSLRLDAPASPPPVPVRVHQGPPGAGKAGRAGLSRGLPGRRNRALLGRWGERAAGGCQVTGSCGHSPPSKSGWSAEGRVVFKDKKGTWPGFRARLQSFLHPLSTTLSSGPHSWPLATPSNDLACSGSHLSGGQFGSSRSYHQL